MTDGIKKVSKDELNSNLMGHAYEKRHKYKRSDTLMTTKSTALLIIDVQDKLIKGLVERDLITWNIRRIIDSASELEIRIFATEQNPNKLGHTTDQINLPEDTHISAKMSFSCCTCYDLLENIKRAQIEKILVCGVESHVCIQQTCLDLIQLGYEVFVPIDAIGSRNKLDHDVAIRRIEGSGGKITTTESTIFEWCENAERKEFKRISAIIKESYENKI